MKTVKLIAPVGGFTFRTAEKAYQCEGNSEVDVPESLVRELLAEGFKRVNTTELVLVQGPQGERGFQGKEGEIGPRGPQGLRGPIGPMPKHEWRGTELRFQMDTDVWGNWVDLQGPPGKDGGGGIAPSGLFGGGPIDLSGIVTTSVNSYFPAGW